MARLRAAFANSSRGFSDIWKAEEAFRLEFITFAVSIPVALWISPRFFDAAVLIASVLAVVIVEVLNSAIEAAIDRIGPERHELSRIAKDLGSLAVLLSILLALIVWTGAILSFLSS